MYGPFVRVLPSRLVLEQRKKKVLPKGGVGVQEDGPSREDDVDSIDILRPTSVYISCKVDRTRLTPSLEISVPNRKINSGQTDL